MKQRLFYFYESFSILLHAPYRRNTKGDETHCSNCVISWKRTCNCKMIAQWLRFCPVIHTYIHTYDTYIHIYTWYKTNMHTYQHHKQKLCQANLLICLFFCTTLLSDNPPLDGCHRGASHTSYIAARFWHFVFVFFVFCVVCISVVVCLFGKCKLELFVCLLLCYLFLH